MAIDNDGLTLADFQTLEREGVEIAGRVANSLTGILRNMEGVPKEIAEKMADGLSRVVDEVKVSSNKITSEFQSMVSDTERIISSADFNFDAVNERLKDGGMRMASSLVSGFGGALEGLSGELIKFQGPGADALIGDMASMFTDQQVLATTAIRAGVNRMVSPLEVLDRRFLAPLVASRRSIADGLKGLTNTFSTDGGALRTSIDEVSEQSVDAVGNLGISFANASKNTTEAMRAFGDIDFLQGISLSDSSEKATRNLSGTSAMMMIAAGSGLEFSSAISHADKMLTSLNISGDDVANRFAQITRAAADTKIPISEFSSTVINASDAFKLYGDNVSESSALLEQLADGLGPGRVGLSQDLFRGIVSGISQMNDGMKAFIGMTGSLNSGGAIEGILAVEEALASGEGLGEIIADAQAQIEQLSGAEIMTRQQAIETGRETEYYVQRQLMDQMIGVGGQQAELFAQAVQGRDLGSAGDILRASTGMTSESALLAEGERRLGEEITPAQRAINVAQGAVEYASVNAAEAIADGSQAMASALSSYGISIKGAEESTTTFARSLDQLAKVNLERLYNLRLQNDGALGNEETDKMGVLKNPNNMNKAASAVSAQSASRTGQGDLPGTVTGQSAEGVGQAVAPATVDNQSATAVGQGNAARTATQNAAAAAGMSDAASAVDFQSAAALKSAAQATTALTSSNKDLIEAINNLTLTMSSNADGEGPANINIEVKVDGDSDSILKGLIDARIANQVKT